jgi:signal transduction protein with GAF and PtsI domain
MRELGRGQKVFDHEPVRGRVRNLEDSDDVLALLDEYERAEDAGQDPPAVIAVVRDAGATFLAPLYHDLTGVICTAGTPRSHIGIVTRDFHIPCVMGCSLDGDLADGDEVELDCSGDEGRVRG